MMPRRRSLTSQLYRAARLSNNLSALASGNPRRVARRAKNVLVGRALGMAGVWRRLWR
jgi:hypothetical protein